MPQHTSIYLSIYLSIYPYKHAIYIYKYTSNLRVEIARSEKVICDFLLRSPISLEIIYEIVFIRFSNSFTFLKNIKKEKHMKLSVSTNL